MKSIDFTLETSHFEMSQLKDFALRNILDMSFTPDTSHAEMAPLKDDANVPTNLYHRSPTDHYCLDL